MRLTRREILEGLRRLGVCTMAELKHACRDYEAHWEHTRVNYREMTIGG